MPHIEKSHTQILNSGNMCYIPFERFYGISAVEIPIVQFIQKIRRFDEFPADFRQEKRSSKSHLINE